MKKMVALAILASLPFSAFSQSSVTNQTETVVTNNVEPIYVTHYLTNYVFTVTNITLVTTERIEITNVVNRFQYINRYYTNTFYYVTNNIATNYYNYIIITNFETYLEACSNYATRAHTDANAANVSAYNASQYNLSAQTYRNQALSYSVSSYSYKTSAYEFALAAMSSAEQAARSATAASNNAIASSSEAALGYAISASNSAERAAYYMDENASYAYMINDMVRRFPVSYSTNEYAYVGTDGNTYTNVIILSANGANGFLKIVSNYLSSSGTIPQTRFCYSRVASPGYNISYQIFVGSAGQYNYYLNGSAYFILSHCSQGIDGLDIVYIPTNRVISSNSLGSGIALCYMKWNNGKLSVHYKYKQTGTSWREASANAIHTHDDTSQSYVYWPNYTRPNVQISFSGGQYSGSFKGVSYGGTSMSDMGLSFFPSIYFYKIMYKISSEWNIDIP